jgi:DnaJ-class molecular chaperone
MTVGPCTLYRFRDRKGELLYVGVSGDPSRRIAQHERSKPWWHAVTQIELEHFVTRDEALAAEERAIRVEQPTYNFRHNGAAFSKPKRGVRRCRRCNGTGSIAKYRHRRDGGVCFDCKGRGHSKSSPVSVVVPLVALLVALLVAMYALWWVS